MSIARFYSKVEYLANNDATYYQKVNIRIDKAVGDGGDFRRVDGRTYSWRTFSGDGLPNEVRSGVKSGLQPDAGQLRAVASVTLMRKRTGPDTRVWRHKTISNTFTCVPFSIGI